MAIDGYLAGSEDCRNAPLLSGFEGTVTGTYGILNDYSASAIGGCSVGYTSGREVVYQVTLNSGDALSIEVSSLNHDVDETIYLIDACPEDGTTFEAFTDNCVAGADDEL